MIKIYSKLFTGILAVLLLGSCVTNEAKKEQAQQALQVFFDQLAQGEYAAAADQYAGSYETLTTFNPDLDPDDYPTLWQYGCQMNGLQCLTLRTATFQEVTNTGEYVFTVEFNTQDGRRFELGACCGEEPTSPPLYQFEYRVVESTDGQFRVLDLPVYMP
jgi:outer membrane murein-binding lipoprotein Lpp